MAREHTLDGNTAALWRFNHGPANGWRQYVRDLSSNGFHALASSLTLSALQRPLGPNRAIVRQGLNSVQLDPPTTDHRFTINSTVVAALKTSYTVEAFVYLSQTTTSRSIVTIGASNALLFRVDASSGGRLRLFWEVTGADQDHVWSTGGTPMVANTWYHIAIVKDTAGAQVHFYLDGVLQQSVAKGAETNHSGTSGFYMSNVGVNLGFSGAVKDFTVIPGTKTQPQLAARAALLSTTFELPVDPAALFHFRGDEASDVFVDEVGKGPTNLVGNIPLIMDRLLPEHRYAPDLIADDGYSVQFWDDNYANSYALGDATFGAAVETLRQVFQSSVGFTFECWVNLGELTPPGQVLRGVFRFGSKFGDPNQANADMNFLMVSINSDGSITYWSEYGTDADSIHTTAVDLVPIGDTFHLAIRRNPTDGGTGLHTVDVFINGVLEETLTGVEPFENGNNATYPQFRLGYGTSPTAEHTMYGYLDDVRISDIPRTNDEILESFELGMPPAPSTDPPVVEIVSPSLGVPPGSPGGFPLNRHLAELTPIVLRIYDVSPGLQYTVVTVTIPEKIDGKTYNKEEVVYRLSQFRGLHVDGSTQRTFTQTIDEELVSVLELTVRRAGGWPAVTQLKFSVDAIDQSGNLGG